MARAAAERLVLRSVEVVGRAENRQHGVALELVDQSVVTVDLLDDHREEPVQQLHDLDGRATRHQLCRAR